MRRRSSSKTDTLIYSWVRRTGSYTGEELPTPDMQNAVKEALKSFKKYAEFRKKLCDIARSFAPFLVCTGDDIPDSGWVCPIDDDDWHSPNIESVLLGQPKDVDVVWWNISSIRWVKPAFFDPLWMFSSRNVPGTCSYAFRCRIFKNISETDFKLLRDDHVFVPIHATRLGLKVVHTPLVGGVWNVTPLSVSILQEFGNRVPTAEEIDIDRILQWPNIPDWIARGIGPISTLIKEYI